MHYLNYVRTAQYVVPGGMQRSCLSCPKRNRGFRVSIFFFFFFFVFFFPFGFDFFVGFHCFRFQLGYFLCDPIPSF